jgi:hypothetical protein
LNIFNFHKKKREFIIPVRKILYLAPTILYLAPKAPKASKHAYEAVRILKQAAKIGLLQILTTDCN